MAITNEYAEIYELTVPRKIKPPYILTIDGGNAIDLNTGVAPVIDTLITVITDDMLASNRPIFATPLTTLVFHMARLDTEAKSYKNNRAKSKAFTKNVTSAASTVSSTFAVGHDTTIDLFRAPLVINDYTTELADQELAVYHRAAVEAFASKVYTTSLSSGATPNGVIQALALDLHNDGAIDNTDNGVETGNINQEILSQDPMELLIPNTVYRVKDIMALMAEERVLIGTHMGPTFLMESIAFPVGTIATDPVETIATDPVVSTEPVVTLSVDNINFGSQDVGETSNPIELMLTNTGVAPLQISGISVSAGFTESNNCNNEVSAGGSCVFDIQFIPETLGDVNGTLTIIGNDAVGTHIISLTGKGSNDTPITEINPLSPEIKLYVDHNSHPIGLYTEQDVINDFDAIHCCGGVVSDSISIVPDPTGDPARGNVMRVFQAQGSHTYEGGSDGQWQGRVGGEHEELYFAFDYYRDPDTVMSKGQKMSGFLGGDWAIASGGTSPNGLAFSSRLMFFADYTYGYNYDNGALAQYTYYLDTVQRPQWYDDNPEIGQYHITAGKWQTIETRIKMNTVGKSDGILQAWVDGVLVLDNQNFVWRDSRDPDLKISGLYVTFGYGGGDDTWDAPEDQFNYYDNWIVSTQPIAH
jgi:hypothetical protein